MNILIVGYGNIGKHIFEELKTLNPDIYDPFILDYSVKQNKKYDFAFICVPTDMLPDGSCDTSVVVQAVDETDANIIVIKSTIPPETTKRLIRVTDKKIVFSPEHYGITQHCKSEPGFIILGGEKELTVKVAELYGAVKNGYHKFYFTDTTTAEMSKYMLNSFLAMKVTFCNEFADLANKFGISYPELRELFVADERVGNSHTYVYSDKPYYDSHCFNKDIPALVKFAEGSAPLMSCVNEINLQRKTQCKGILNNYPEPQISHAKKTYIGKLSQDAKVEKLRGQEEVLKNKLALLEQSRRTNFKYYCAICLIIRDENEYLEEWLRWHIDQGVEYFYIYDHGSKNSVEKFIQSLPLDISKKITVTDWSGVHEHAQSEAYTDCLVRYRKESKWIGFIDADEQVFIKNGQSLSEFLENYEEFAGVFAIWRTFNANGHIKKSSAPLRERFTQISKHNEFAGKAGKVFVQPLYMQEMYIHNGYPVDGFCIVDENRNVVQEYLIAKENPSTDLICVDHFYTKSYEEWVEKLKRGSCDSNFSRKYDEFFEFNPEMKYCREEVFPVQEYEMSDKTVNEQIGRR